MAEFEMKRLVDVETVETVSDEASVLIVQDGEVKQTAKTNVGGGGGGVSAPICFYVSGHLYLDETFINAVDVETVVEAYFAGNAYVMSDSMPQKVTGFAISSAKGGGVYYQRCDTNAISSGFIKDCSVDQLEACVSEHLAALNG